MRGENEEDGQRLTILFYFVSSSVSSVTLWLVLFFGVSIVKRAFHPVSGFLGKALLGERRIAVAALEYSHLSAEPGACLAQGQVTVHFQPAPPAERGFLGP